MPRHRFITLEEQKQIDELLRELLKNSDAKTALLLDQGGFLMSVQGFTEHLDPQTIAVLAAGSFATTRELAKLIGEEGFTVMFHQGRRDNIHISAVGKDVQFRKIYFFMSDIKSFSKSKSLRYLI